MRIIKITSIAILLFILIIAAPSDKKFQTDEAKPFVAEFIRLGKLFNINNIEERTLQVAIRFGDTKEKELANCSYYLREVTLSRKHWASLPIENKEEVIFHELGHCVLNIRTHTETGIMKAIGLHEPFHYAYSYEYLMNQFFANSEVTLVELKWDTDKYSSSKETQVTLAEVMNNKHAVIRFTATWCPPCKALAPVFTEVAEAHPNVKVYVVDVDENPTLATEMNVRGIPCMVEIRDNKIDTVLVGNQPKPEIEKLFE